MQAKSIRLELASREVDQRLTDQSTGQTPAIWQGDVVSVDLLFRNVRTGAVETDFADVVTFQLELISLAGTLLRSLDLAPDDLDETVDEDTWAAGTKQHLRFALTSEQTTLGLTTPRQTAFLAVYILRTSGQRVTLGTTQLHVHRALHDSDATPAADPDRYVTQAQLTAALAAIELGLTPSEDGMFYEIADGGRVARIAPSS